MSKLGKVPPWQSVSLADCFQDALEATDPRVIAARQAETRTQPLVQYQRDPLGFLVDVLGVQAETVAWSRSAEYRTHGWDGTRDPLLVALESVANGEWIAVSSGTGTGKTFLMAALLLWHTACFEDSIAVTVATKEDQMAKGVWREVGRMWDAFKRRFPLAELTHLRIRMDPSRGDAWAAWAVTAKVGAEEESAKGVQGLHAARLLILADEMPGIPQPIITALINTATDDANVIAGFGNPDNETDPLAKFGRIGRVRPIRVSALDHPNVVLGRSLVPGAVSRGSIQMRADTYGMDSPFYGSRVRGIPPAQAADALIHRAWCEAAVARGAAWIEAKALERYPVAYGVDPSNSDGGDEAAVARFQGPMCLQIRAQLCPDANVLGREVLMLAQADGADPAHIGVDAIGVGAGTVNEIRRLLDASGQHGQQATALNSGAAPIYRQIARGADGSGWTADANVFLNLRAQMYWQAREDLRLGLIGIPNDPDLIEELIMPTYAQPRGKVTIEPKDDIKRRLGRSPNRADAFVYGNWVRPRTLPPPALPENIGDKNLGVVRDPMTGKVRPKRPDDVAKHPGRPKPEDYGGGNWWSGWGRG